MCRGWGRSEARARGSGVASSKRPSPARRFPGSRCFVAPVRRSGGCVCPIPPRACIPRPRRSRTAGNAQRSRRTCPTGTSSSRGVRQSRRPVSRVRVDAGVCPPRDEDACATALAVAPTAVRPGGSRRAARRRRRWRGVRGGDRRTGGRVRSVGVRNHRRRGRSCRVARSADTGRTAGSAGIQEIPDETGRLAAREDEGQRGKGKGVREPSGRFPHATENEV